MTPSRENIIAHLQKELLTLQGFKTAKSNYPVDTGLGVIAEAFPNKTFPLGAVHEFITGTMEDASASAAFITALLGPLLQTGGVLCWIGSGQLVFPSALKQFGINPDRIIFIDTNRKKDIAWTIEEALQCEALTAVVAEWSDMNFVESRRLQLAVEKSQVTGCIIRRNPKQFNTTAAVSRWRISPLASMAIDNLPGLGFSRWNIELLKVRNGKPGNWIFEWAGDHLRHVEEQGAIIRELTRKTG